MVFNQPHPAQHPQGCSPWGELWVLSIMPRGVQALCPRGHELLELLALGTPGAEGVSVTHPETAGWGKNRIWSHG